MRLLFVENDVVFSRVVVSTFLSAHDVTVVPTIRRALAAARARRYEAVLVDYDLDDGKGVELVVELRAVGYDGLIVAASSHERGNRALLGAGADRACSKLEFHLINESLAASPCFP